MEKNKENLKIANRQYEVEDYQRNDQVSAGLATTHEQVSDVYMEGEIMPEVENLHGENKKIP